MAGSGWAVESVPALPTWPWFVLPSRMRSSSATAADCAITVKTIPRTHSTVPVAASTFLLPKSAMTPRTIPTAAATAVTLFRKTTGEPTTPMTPRMSAVHARPAKRVGFGAVWTGACGIGAPCGKVMVYTSSESMY